MNQLIFWNESKYADVLANIFGRENVITNKDQILSLYQDWGKFSSLIVLCELNWSLKGGSVHIQNLHGIELVKELRRPTN